MPFKPHKHRALSKPKHIHKREQRHYLPYLPLFILVIGTFILSFGQPVLDRKVLAYATSVSSSGLLAATNNQRTQNGSGTLAINNALTSAAQAKADDMIARNYWSHNTPDGQQPWVFMDKTGYKYLKAGENLAYGFLTSDDTVTGWMNSPSHRDNLLDKAFTEVGFGFANGENYNNSGNETVVVAMYGKPQVLASTQQPAPTASQPKPAATPAPAPATAIATKEAHKSQPFTSDTKTSKEPQTQEIARVQTMTNGQASWTLFVSGLLAGAAIIVLLIKHAAGLRHLIRDSERFVLHHPMLDTVLVSIVMAGSYLSQTTGFIR